METGASAELAAASAADVSSAVGALPAKEVAKIREAIALAEGSKAAKTTRVVWASGELVVEVSNEAEMTVADLKEHIAATPNAPPKCRQKLVADAKILTDSEVITPYRQLLLVHKGNAPSAGIYKGRKGYGRARLQLAEDGSVVGDFEYYDCPPEGVPLEETFTAKGDWQYEDDQLSFTWATAFHKDARSCTIWGTQKTTEEDAKKKRTSATWNAETGIMTWYGLELLRDDTRQKPIAYPPCWTKGYGWELQKSHPSVRTGEEDQKTVAVIPDTRSEACAAAAHATHGFRSGTHYFEVKVLTASDFSYVGLVSTDWASQHLPVGRAPQSWGIASDGAVLAEGVELDRLPVAFGDDSVLGFLLQLGKHGGRTATAFINGRCFENVFTDLAETVIPAASNFREPARFRLNCDFSVPDW